LELSDIPKEKKLPSDIPKEKKLPSDILKEKKLPSGFQQPAPFFAHFYAYGKMTQSSSEHTPPVLSCHIPEDSAPTEQCDNLHISNTCNNARIEVSFIKEWVQTYRQSNLVPTNSKDMYQCCNADCSATLTLNKGIKLSQIPNFRHLPCRFCEFPLDLYEKKFFSSKGFVCRCCFTSYSFLCVEDLSPRWSCSTCGESRIYLCTPNQLKKLQYEDKRNRRGRSRYYW
jgi:hypothetical protein